MAPNALSSNPLSSGTRHQSPQQDVKLATVPDRTMRTKKQRRSRKTQEPHESFLSSLIGKLKACIPGRSSSPKNHAQQKTTAAHHQSRRSSRRRASRPIERSTKTREPQNSHRRSTMPPESQPNGPSHQREPQSQASGPQRHRHRSSRQKTSPLNERPTQVDTTSQLDRQHRRSGRHRMASESHTPAVTRHSRRESRKAEEALSGGINIEPTRQLRTDHTHKREGNKQSPLQIHDATDYGWAIGSYGQGDEVWETYGEEDRRLGKGYRDESERLGI